MAPFHPPKRATINAGSEVRARVSRAVAATALLAALLAPAAVMGRAGGGEDFVSFGDGGGGGVDVGDIGALIYLVVAYPEVGVPLAIIVIVVVIVKRLRNPDRLTRRAVSRLDELGTPDTSGLAVIRERDPAFDETAFLARARRVADAVQDSWARGDMAPVRALLSDGLLRRFETQLVIMNKQGVRDALADHHVIEARIHAVENGSHFDAIHVALRAEVRDTEVEATLRFEDATARAARAPLRPYVEIWSFLRRPGTATLAGRGPLESSCPNCGAPTPGAQTTRCDHCHALVNSGDHDWVLAEITQPEVWRPSSVGEVPGLSELSARDERFNRQAAEDRGAYVFWRWIEAAVTGDARPLAKCASPEMREKMAEQTRRIGPAPMFKTALGSVDLIGCEAGEAGGRDRFHARMLWSTARSPGDRPFPAANVFTLGRRAGARDPGGLSYARCPECHGPLGENDSPHCDYCGAHLAAGESDWVLEDVRRPEEVSIARLGVGTAGADANPSGWIPDMSNPRERNLLLMRIAAVAAADGQITAPERKLLETCARRWGVPWEAISPILSGQIPPEIASTMKPSDPVAFFSGLVVAGLVDGRIDPKEERLLRAIGTDLSLPERTVSETIRSLTAAARTGRARRSA